MPLPPTAADETFSTFSPTIGSDGGKKQNFAQDSKATKLNIASFAPDLTSGASDVRTLASQLVDAHEDAVAAAVEAALSPLRVENHALHRLVAELKGTIASQINYREQSSTGGTLSAVASLQAAVSDGPESLLKQPLLEARCEHVAPNTVKDSYSENVAGSNQHPNVATCGLDGDDRTRDARAALGDLEDDDRTGGASAALGGLDGDHRTRDANAALGGVDGNDRTRDARTPPPTRPGHLQNCPPLSKSVTVEFQFHTWWNAAALAAHKQNGCDMRCAVGPLRNGSARCEGDVAKVLCAERMISRPECRCRASWELVGMGLIFWDLLYIPIGVFDFPSSTFTRTMEWVTRIYWTADIPLTFTVGYFDVGVVVMDPLAIAVRYLRTTFLLDLLVVAVDWLVAGASVRVFKVLRIARILRLLRVMKLKKFLALVHDHVSSEYMSLIMDFALLTATIVISSHFVACGYYFIGVSVEGGLSWVRAEGLHEESMILQYFASLYWGITTLLLETTFQPQNTTEYVYCIIVIILGLICFSTIVSRITGLLLEIRNLRADTTQQLWKLRRFFCQNEVPMELARRVMRYLEYKEEQKRMTVQESDLPFLASLTLELRNQLRYVAYMQALRLHPLLLYIERVCEVTMHRICEHGAHIKPLAGRDPLFFQDDEAKHMHVLARGDVLYVTSAPGCIFQYSFEADTSASESKPLGLIKNTFGKNTFFAEAALWVPWQFCGSAYAVTECFVVLVDVHAFGDVVKNCSQVCSKVATYARRVLRVLERLQKDHDISDIISMKDSETSLSLSFQDCATE
eukprot:CAMPEP_0117567692 /NCGR_PEP_ID=MMETSP0784-20121206/57738_1 /TAXON_ID=39447 /ORGANISM="" /LENGTH=801 /DNA_ID=CAMNT_0005365571 /DNA_START=29 /DNA_END=2434 /DNA_ORIENTATION=+